MTLQPGLYLTWSETQIAVFLMHRLIFLQGIFDVFDFSLGCNTWPKKRFKQPKKHVKELFDIMNSEESSTVEGLIDPNQGRVLRGKGAPMNILPAGELCSVVFA